MKKFFKWFGIALLALFIIGVIIPSDDEESEEVEVATEEESTEPEETESEAEAEAEETESEEEVEAVEEEETEEPEEDNNVLSDEDVSNLEKGLSDMLNDKYQDISVHSFEYEDNRISTMVDMQTDPLPSKLEAEDIMADITWYIAEMNEVVDTSDFHITASLVSDTGDGEFIQWLSERWYPDEEEYDMTEHEAFDILN